MRLLYFISISTMYARKRVTKQTDHYVGCALSEALSTRRLSLFASYSGFILTGKSIISWKLFSSLVLLLIEKWCPIYYDDDIIHIKIQATSTVTLRQMHSVISSRRNAYKNVKTREVYNSAENIDAISRSRSIYVYHLFMFPYNCSVLLYMHASGCNFVNPYRS